MAEELPVLALTTPCSRNQIPCSSDRSGVFRPPSAEVCGAPAHRRRTSGAASVTPRRRRENCWRMFCFVLHLFSFGKAPHDLASRRSRLRPARCASPPACGRARGSSRKNVGPAPGRRPRPDSPGAQKSLVVYANPLKMLKMAMGRPCRELAPLHGRRRIGLASAPRLFGPRTTERRSTPSGRSAPATRIGEAS